MRPMRMRDVCQRTGLTDRTVRYWTEQGLLSPEREEQNGRMYFRFAEEDVQALERIALLRRAGFSVAAIGEMQRSPAAIAPAVEELRRSLREQRDTAQKAETLMETAGGCASLEELEALLRQEPAITWPEPRYDRFDLLTEEERREAGVQAREGLDRRERRRSLLLNLGCALLLVLLAVGATLLATGRLRREPPAPAAWTDRFLPAALFSAPPGEEGVEVCALGGAAPEDLCLDGASSRPAALFSLDSGHVALSWNRLGAAETELLEAFIREGGDAMLWMPDPEEGPVCAVCYVSGSDGWYALHAEAEHGDAAALLKLLDGTVALTLRNGEDGAAVLELREGDLPSAK